MLSNKRLTDILTMFTDRAIRILVGLWVSVWMARYLGVEEFGMLSYAIAFVGMFTSLSTMGVQLNMVRDLAQAESSAVEMVSSAAFLRGIGGFVFMGIAILLAWKFEQGTSNFLIMVVILSTGLLWQGFELAEYYLNAIQKFKSLTVAKNSIFLIFSLVKLLWLYNGATAIDVAYIIVAEQMCLAVWMAFLMKEHGLIKKTAIRLQTIKKLLNEGKWLVVTGMSIALYMRIDQVMIGSMLGESAVGEFAAAIKLSESWYFVPVSIASVFAPALYAKISNSEEEFNDTLVKVMTLLGGLGIAAAITVSLISNLLVDSLFGAQYAQAAPILVIHVWAGFFVCIAVANNIWFTANHLNNYMTIITIFGAILNIALNYFLLPIYGAIAAAVATVVSQGCCSIVFPLFFKKLRGLSRVQLESLKLSSLYKNA